MHEEQKSVSGLKEASPAKNLLNRPLEESSKPVRPFSGDTFIRNDYRDAQNEDYEHPEFFDRSNNENARSKSGRNDTLLFA